MSLLINGMDMPKHAVMNGTDDTMYRSCILVHPDGTAELVVDLEYAYQFNFEHNLKRFTLSEIPTPHGDLIDRDDLLAYFDRKAKGKTAEEALKLLYTALKAYPTIIEAEGKA